MDASSHRNRNGCGLGEWFRPAWLQKYATTRSFLAVYGLLGTIQSMAYVYWVATLTTFERRFRIPSKTTGIMLSGNEISQILLALFLTYFGGQRNRPLWIAWGVAFSAASCYVLVLPHILYGPGEYALGLTKEYANSLPSGPNTTTTMEKLSLCSTEDNSENCDMKTGGEFSKAPAILVFLSQFILGIGSTLYFALGQTYIDDNANKAKTPMYLGLTMSLRTVGPAFGFIFGYACLSLFIDPTLTPLIKQKDPRWLGAWWLGWLLLGTIMFLFAIFISMFPKDLSSLKEKKEINENEIKNNSDDKTISNGITNGKLTLEVPKKKPPTMKEFPAAFNRLCTNKLLITNIFGTVFYVLGGSGYITYLHKYLEVQFNRTAAGASLIIGPVTLMSFVMGFLVSGIVISKFKPRPLYLLGWNVVTGCFFIFGELLFTSISCSDNNIVGYNFQNNSVNVLNDCNMGCGCNNLKYSPVCLEQYGLTFYTACHAGCKTMTKENDYTNFSNCSCIPLPLPRTDDNFGEEFFKYDGVLKEGACPAECGYNFIIFIVVSFIMHSIGSSGKVGNILVNYRAVDPEDKAFGQGLSLLLISLLSFIPGPILFGAIIDSTCLIWDRSCGTRGNCWFYDKKAFRHKLNFTAAAITTVAVVLDAVVCYLGRDLNIYDDEDDDNKPEPVKPAPVEIEKNKKAVDSDNEEGPLKYEYLPQKP